MEGGEEKRMGILTWRGPQITNKDPVIYLHNLTILSKMSIRPHPILLKNCKQLNVVTWTLLSMGHLNLHLAHRIESGSTNPLRLYLSSILCMCILSYGSTKF
jgi:hypothetical protein